MSFFRFIFLFYIVLCHGQNPYPQDYFSSPLKQNLILSGTFGELRTNHFHSGLDLKTNGKKGLNVYAAAQGYVSRVKISRNGYGKALYITHPNGYISVYGHLQKFAPKIEAYVKSKQYENEQFEIQLFPRKFSLKVDADELVAFSGNTGGSSGPHLHFEIRDKQERPINPMLFGIEIQDSTKPALFGLFAYPLTDKSHINGEKVRQKITFSKQADGSYKTDPLSAFGSIGFGIISNDRQDAAVNKNGLALINCYINGQKTLEVDFKRFSFHESKHINRYIDYSYFRTKKQRIQKLFIEKSNPLSIFTYEMDKGKIQVSDKTNFFYLIQIKDYNGNMTSLNIPINGIFMELAKKPNKTAYATKIYARKAKILREENVWVDIPANSFYDDVSLDFEVKKDTLRLHPSIIPLQKSIEINFNIEQYTDLDAEQLFIGSVSDYGKMYYIFTKRKGDTLSARTKYLGTYALGLDSQGPLIRPVNFKNNSWISRHLYLKVKISDTISGINNYTATINGNWILMEYDSKTNILTYDFKDGISNSTENNLKIIVTDNVGNSSKFESTFYRKTGD